MEKSVKLTPLEELFKNFNGEAEDYKVVIEWGDPVGEEVW